LNIFARHIPGYGGDRRAMSGVPFGMTSIVAGFALAAVMTPASTGAVAPSPFPVMAGDRLEPLAITREARAPGIISAGSLNLPANVAMSIVRASAGTGVDLKLLIAVAQRESAFRAEAKARTSSATGLYQFIDSTWLTAVREFGARHGLTREAAIIGPAGEVEDSARRACILNLRKNPDIAAAMAAEMLRRDASYLKASLERNATDTDLYAAHFLGARKAAKLAALAQAKPRTPAARLFPRAARANRSIFYQKKGRKLKSRTVQGVYDRLALPYAPEVEEVARKARDIFGELKPAGSAG